LAGTTNSGVYRARVDDFTWTPAATGLPPRSDVHALYAQEQGLLFAGLVTGGVYASQDSGATWTARNKGLEAPEGPQDVNVFSFLALPRQEALAPTSDATTLLAGTSRGLYRTDDGGASWQAAEASGVGIGATRVLSLALDPLKPNDIVAGTDIGVYHSQDGGRSWRPLGFGLPADLYVGAVGVLHPSDGEPLVLAAVDQLYQYPGRWALATQPSRARSSRRHWRGAACALGALGVASATMTSVT
jgi:hypothetical protein